MTQKRKPTLQLPGHCFSTTARSPRHPSSLRAAKIYHELKCGRLCVRACAAGFRARRDPRDRRGNRLLGRTSSWQSPSSLQGVSFRTQSRRHRTSFQTRRGSRSLRFRQCCVRPSMPASPPTALYRWCLRGASKRLPCTTHWHRLASAVACCRRPPTSLPTLRKWPRACASKALQPWGRQEAERRCSRRSLFGHLTCARSRKLPRGFAACGPGGRFQTASHCASAF